jgi:hypothetical protein
MVFRTLRMAIVHTTIKELVWVLPLPNARLSHDTSLDYQWVTRTLSQYTSLREW